MTKPEERLEQEPDWVKQVKKATGELKPEPVQETLVEQPVSEKIASEPEPVPLPASLEDLGKSEAERDDSFAWLESLAAKQGATEGWLTKPEERLEEEPEWVRQAKDQDEIGIAPSMGMPEEMEAPAEKPVPIPDVSSWLKSLDEPQEQPITPPASADDLPAWIQDVGEASYVNLKTRPVGISL